AGIRPPIGVAASTWRRSASSAGVANSKRYRLMEGLPLREPGAQAQPLAAIDVEVGLQVQAQVDARHQWVAQVRLAVAEPLHDRAPAVEPATGVEAEPLQLTRLELLGPETHGAD